MNIDIVSKDKRYEYLNGLLCQNGFKSRICRYNEVNNPNVLILSVRNELTDRELIEVFKKVSPQAIVFSGSGHRIKEYFKGKVIDYSKNEDFLEKNAYLTAEAMVSIWHSELLESPKEKMILISGYGRIGKHLAHIFSSLGAKIYVFARRNEVKEEILKDGYIPVSLDFSSEVDAIFNTVPATIFSKEQIEKIPQEVSLFDLASICGFEDKARVKFALGLPGKILPNGAGQVVYETILAFLLRERTI